jgi:hypothetical protein
MNLRNAFLPNLTTNSTSIIDYSETQTVKFSDLFSSKVLKFINVSGSNTVTFPSNIQLSKLFSNPTNGSCIQYTIEFDSSSFNIVYDDGTLNLQDSIVKIFIQISTADPLVINLYSALNGTFFGGYTGGTGYTGATGYQATGFTGSTGVTGYTGYTGYQTTGYTGFTGSTGVTGYTGYTGYQTTGYTGFTGSTGVTGYTGYTGGGYRGPEVPFTGLNSFPISTAGLGPTFTNLSAGTGNFTATNKNVNATIAGNTNFGSISAFSATGIYSNNSVFGYSSLPFVETGINNCALGSSAGVTSADSTTSNATMAGYRSGGRDYTCSLGVNSLNFCQSTGLSCIGFNTIKNFGSTGCVGNVGIGDNTLLNYRGTGTTSIGSNSGVTLSTGSNNILIGANAGMSYSGYVTSVINIGSLVATPPNNYISLGQTPVNSGGPLVLQTKCYIAGTRGITTSVSNAVAVLVDSFGQFGTVSSSSRYKDNIAPITNSSLLHQLKPVSFNYKTHSSQDKQYGFIAEEVLTVLPELVVFKDEIPDTVQYHQFYGLIIAELQRMRNEYTTDLDLIESEL